MKLLVAFLFGAAAATVVAVVVLAPNAPSSPPMPAAVEPVVVEAEEATQPVAPPAPEITEPVEERRPERPIFRPPVITRAAVNPVMDFEAPPTLEFAAWSPGPQEWLIGASQLDLPAPEPNRVTLDSGTLLTVRLVDMVSSERHQAGDTFLASLDEPIIANGFVIAERGANVEGRVVAVEQAGRVKGKAVIAIELIRFETSDGQAVDVHTQAFEREAPSEKTEEARRIGVGASLGALIGAIAGGGKGAAIGAAIGGGASTGAVLATKGPPAVLASETRITFRLNDPVTIVEKI